MSYIEYWLHYTDGDLITYQGRDWRQAKRLAAWLKEDPHHGRSDVCQIERVETSGNDADGVTDRHYVPLYDRLDGHKCEGVHSL